MKRDIAEETLLQTLDKLKKESLSLKQQLESSQALLRGMQEKEQKSLVDKADLVAKQSSLEKEVFKNNIFFYDVHCS